MNFSVSTTQLYVVLHVFVSIEGTTMFDISIFVHISVRAYAQHMYADYLHQHSEALGTIAATSLQGSFQ